MYFRYLWNWGRIIWIRSLPCRFYINIMVEVLSLLPFNIWNDKKMKFNYSVVYETININVKIKDRNYSKKKPQVDTNQLSRWGSSNIDIIKWVLKRRVEINLKGMFSASKSCSTLPSRQCISVLLFVWPQKMFECLFLRILHTLHTHNRKMHKGITQSDVIKIKIKITFNSTQSIQCTLAKNRPLQLYLSKLHFLISV